MLLFELETFIIIIVSVEDIRLRRYVHLFPTCRNWHEPREAEGDKKLI